jgi:hypothetical protein
MLRRWTALSGAALIAVALVVLPAETAEANDAGISVTNFSESRGCEPFVAGIAKPNVSRQGTIPLNEQIRGPWGEMFGRTYQQVSSSLVTWKLPGSSKTLRVHNRMLPALEIAAANLNGHLAQGKSYSVYSAFAWLWRTVGGTVRISEHAMGTAFDINPPDNPYSSDNRLRTNLPDWFVDSFVDAGFCWGGDWVDVKDAMHFSWSGPIATPDYPGRVAPYGPVTSRTNFTQAPLTFTSRTDWSNGSSMAIADVTGEGAPDVLRLTPSGRFEASTAIGDYRTTAIRQYLSGGSDGGLFADYDGDGRADVWAVVRSGSSYAFDVYTSMSGYVDAQRVGTSIPQTVEQLLIGHADDDYIPDIYARSGGGFDVYGSQNGFSSSIGRIPFPAGADATWRFATGDHDVDGMSDIYAVGPGSPAPVRVRTASGGGYTASANLAVGGDSLVDTGDYDGDGRDDLFVLNGSQLAVSLGGNTYGDPDFWFQRSTTTVPDAGPECTGSACDTIGYVDEGGKWFLAETPGSEAPVSSFYYGNPRDVPFMGDWSCDGTDTPGLYRQSDGFVYVRNTNTQGIADRQFYFGNPSDVPIVGDFNGDGCDTVSVFRPSQQRMYIINELGDADTGLGAADYFFEFGNPSDIPFVGDFDGDGIDEIGIYRGATRKVYLKWELAGGGADAEFAFGEPGDIPIAGDWNGDGIDTVALYRPSNGYWYFTLTNSGGSADHAVHFHDHDNITLPVAGRIG